MPSKSINLDTEQLAYIEQTSTEGESFSERARELIDKGIQVEDTEKDK